MLVYEYDTQTKLFEGLKDVEDDYQLQAGETTVAPEQGLYDATFNGTSWVGITQEEWLKRHADEIKIDATAVEPSQSDEAVNALGMQIAQLQAQLAQANNAINALGLQIAQSNKN